MFRNILRSAPFAAALAALVLAGPADAGGHKWKHHKRHHGHHHDHGCEHGDFYAPRYVEHRYREYPVYYYEPRPVYHPIVVFELPSLVFGASIGGGVDWDRDD